jgi:hypothetical protein
MFAMFQKAIFSASIQNSAKSEEETDKSYLLCTVYTMFHGAMSSINEAAEKASWEQAGIWVRN